MPCFFTLAPCSRPLVPGGMTKAAWPREPSSRSTEAITTWTFAIPPLVAQAFWPLITHSSLRLVVLGGGPVAGHVRAGVGLGSAERADLDVVLVAEALGHPLDHLLGRAGAEDPRDREGRPEDRHADPGVAPEELLVDDREGKPGRVGPELRDRLEAVHADLRGLLHHRPGELLLLVPLVGGGADRLLGEAVRPVADVLLVLRELQRECGVAGLDPELLGDLSLDVRRSVRRGCAVRRNPCRAGGLLFRRHLSQSLLFGAFAARRGRLAVV